MTAEVLRSKRKQMKETPDRFPVGGNGTGVGEENASLKVERERYVQSWAEISGKLPETFNPQETSFTRDYFRAQMRLAQGRKKKAKRIFKGLLSKPGYRDFEASNKSVLAAVDFAVKGFSNWEDEMKKKIEPAFTID